MPVTAPINPLNDALIIKTVGFKVVFRGLPFKLVKNIFWHNVPIKPNAGEASSNEELASLKLFDVFRLLNGSTVYHIRR